jgi:hypothetical protein
MRKRNQTNSKSQVCAFLYLLMRIQSQVGFEPTNRSNLILRAPCFYSYETVSPIAEFTLLDLDLDCHAVVNFDKRSVQFGIHPQYPVSWPATKVPCTDCAGIQISVPHAILALVVACQILCYPYGRPS